VIVWCETNDESRQLAKAIPDAIEVHGSMSPEAKVEALDSFTFGKSRVIVSKPKLAGLGLNWQHASTVSLPASATAMSSTIRPSAVAGGSARHSRSSATS
jgi:hypothetical protein